jgi:histidyl-tRNA synthetase
VERILLALEAEKVALPGAPPPQVTVIAAGDTGERRAAAVLAHRLRRRFRTAVDLLDRGLGGQMRAADKAGSRLAIVVGAAELEAGTWTVKEMATGEQESVDDASLEATLERRLAEEKNR